MSGKFGGFTQDDIKKITTGSSRNNKENTGNATSAQHSNNLKTASFPANRPRAKAVLPKTIGSSAEPARTQPSVNLPEMQDISLSSSSSDTSSIENSLKEALHFKPLPLPEYQQSESSPRESSPAGSLPHIQSTVRDENIAEETAPPVFKGVSLRDYEAQRRMIEEQNRHKKQMIYKAIEQRSEKTAAESKKLQTIKDDLEKLEADLVKDVSILRKKIETASIRYTSARQYYEQIEGAFLKAKFEMQQSREQKDLLAEHLNIIITSNEDRKAHKLSELMAKVGLDTMGEVVQEKLDTLEA